MVKSELGKQINYLLKDGYILNEATSKENNLLELKLKKFGFENIKIEIQWTCIGLIKGNKRSIK